MAVRTNGWIKGSKHTDETRQKMAATRTGRHHSAEHKARISAANRGKIHEKKHENTCACGNSFKSASPFAKFCSEKCKKASLGHGLRHAPQFKKFAQICAICGAESDLVGDHDHGTGKPRGILCRNCNLAIGNMRDDPERLRRAAEYLEAAA